MNSARDYVRPSSPNAKSAGELVGSLQRRFADSLLAICARLDDETLFHREYWARDEGKHGGGNRLGAAATSTFNQATLNISHVHYDDDATRPLGAAVALSAIVHPRHPRVPSAHLHFSYTEMKDGTGSFRLMADLNPAIPFAAETSLFVEEMRRALGALSASAKAQGDAYFQIPALGRTRGVAHFYLEGYGEEAAGTEARSFAKDLAFVRSVGEVAIDTYVQLLGAAFARVDGAAPTEEEERAQLAYHTLYLFQVLTLDRGTTSGLMVHDQNDAGIMGSLPIYVDKALLLDWKSKVTAPQDALVQGLVDALPEPDASGRSFVDHETRLRLAAVVRAHYTVHPEALALQASGGIEPTPMAATKHART